MRPNIAKYANYGICANVLIFLDQKKKWQASFCAMIIFFPTTASFVIKDWSEISKPSETYDGSGDHNYKVYVSLFPDVAPIKVICVVCRGPASIFHNYSDGRH